jgi:hypothetical protein
VVALTSACWPSIAWSSAAGPDWRAAVRAVLLAADRYRHRAGILLAALVLFFWVWANVHLGHSAFVVGLMAIEKPRQGAGNPGSTCPGPASWAALGASAVCLSIKRAGAARSFLLNRIFFHSGIAWISASSRHIRCSLISPSY